MPQPAQQPASTPETSGGALLSPYQLFMLFSHTASLGFGGVLPWCYRMLVERRQLVSKAEFGEMFAFSQILPGPPVCNIAVLVGHRHAGILGSFAALAGMVAVPTVLVIILGVVYRHFGDLAPVRHALGGMAAVAAGLVVAISLQMALDMPRRWKHIFFAALMFACIGLARWPLLYVLLVLAPLAVAAFWKESADGR